MANFAAGHRPVAKLSHIITLRYLDEAEGFLVPRSSSSFPVPRPRSPFLVLVPRSGSSFPRSSFLVHRFITPAPPSEKGASHTLGIIYTIIFNTLVRGMPVLKTRNSLNLISTERGGTKNPRKIIYHAQGTVPGLRGTGVLPVLRVFVSSRPLKSFYK